MSHERPLPPAATPPWPAHPAPAAEAVAVVAEAKRLGAAAEAQSGSNVRKPMGIRTAAGIGAAVGIGSAAIVAALLYANRKPGK